MSSIRMPKTDKMLKTLYKYGKKWYNIEEIGMLRITLSVFSESFHVQYYG